MKKLKLLLLTTTLFVLAACSGNKAKDAFADNRLHEGSTYEQVIDEIGEPGHEFKNDYGCVLSYLSLTEKFYVLLEKTEDGTLKVTKFSTETSDGAGYELYLRDKD